MENVEVALEGRLKQMVLDCGWLMQALCAVRDLGLPSWCIGAGAIRNAVWDALSGHTRPSALSDVDVAFFDASDLTPERDAALQRRLAAAHPGVPWEVTNQAAVHLWFESYFGHAVAPLRSLEEAVGTWPEYATSVGIWLDAEDAPQVVAPHGLEDLFAMVVRRNPTRASVRDFNDRTASKRYAERWPKVRIVPA
ncbi:nucleotidyltransferase family protein [Roseateles sp. So40a]|uniref:nucleotidyltransferase family protein n=1 Tax=Roseateles sp. So40a TaxID=3400226 RepID=UPI003A84C22E